MRIAIIGSTSYRWMMDELLSELTENGDEVRIPAFDSHTDLDELGICEYNRDMIEWADEVHLIWDARSQGTIFDFGMTFALRKPLVIEYIESKTFRGVMEKYATKREG